MFKNIGKKIKYLAWIVFIAGCVASVTFSIIHFCTYINIGPGFIYLIVGPILSWLASAIIYGFGELIDNSTNTSQNIKRLKEFLVVEVYNEEKKEPVKRTVKISDMYNAGIISQESYDKILSSKMHIIDFEELRNKDIITDEEKNNIVAYLKEYQKDEEQDKKENSNNIKTVPEPIKRTIKISDMYKEGLISQESYNKILSSGVKSLNFKELKEKKIITEEECNKIKAYMKGE